MTGLGSSCGACKFLRRKCTSECVFAPYFCYDEAATHFAAVHKVFGASNVSKLLLHMPLHSRGIAAITISYEALARIRDPVYGCVAHIFALQQQVASLQEEVEILGTQMANLGVGIASIENTQISSIISCDEMQFYPQQAQDAMDMQCHEDQAAAALLCHSEYSTGEQSFGWSKIPVNDWEDPNPIFEFDPNSLERLLEGVDNDIFACCSFLDTSNCIS